MQHAHTGMKSLVGTHHQKRTDIYIGAANKMTLIEPRLMAVSTYKRKKNGGDFIPHYSYHISFTTHWLEVSAHPSKDHYSIIIYFTKLVTLPPNMHISFTPPTAWQQCVFRDN